MRGHSIGYGRELFRFCLRMLVLFGIAGPLMVAIKEELMYTVPSQSDSPGNEHIFP